MANNKKNIRKKNSSELPINAGLLLFVLIICAVIIICIAVFSGGDNGKDTDNTSGTDDGTGSVNDITDGIDTPDADDSTSQNDEDSNTIEESDDSSADTSADTTVNVPDDTTTIDPETSKDPESDTTEPITETTETEDEETETTVNDDTTSDTESSDKNDEPVTDPEESKVDEEKLNSIVNAYITSKLENELASGNEDFKYELKETNLMFADENFASVVVKGEYFIDNSEPPTSFAYTVNCDMKIGSVVMTDSLVNDFTKVKNLFTSGKFTLSEGIDGLLDETNYEDMFMEYRPEYGIYPDVYFTSDSFGMVIELVDTLGGYALFEIPYSDIEGSVFNPTV